jgi:hypothetical protein
MANSSLTSQFFSANLKKRSDFKFYKWSLENWLTKTNENLCEFWQLYPKDYDIWVAS